MKPTQRRRKKLQLNRETIRSLPCKDLNVVATGSAEPTMSNCNMSSGPLCPPKC